MSKNRGNGYRYQVCRSEARKAAQDFAKENQNLINRGVDTTQIGFEPITQSAIEASYLWGDEATLYPWDEVNDWKQKDTRGFDISLWFAQELCGLCYATPRKLNFETRGVSMHKPKHEPKPMMAARFQAEARATLAKRTDKRSRFLDVALSQGREFEPVGRLAG